jgi:hypothetical protein
MVCLAYHYRHLYFSCHLFCCLCLIICFGGIYIGKIVDDQHDGPENSDNGKQEFEDFQCDTDESRTAIWSSYFENIVDFC